MCAQKLTRILRAESERDPNRFRAILNRIPSDSIENNSTIARNGCQIHQQVASNRTTLRVQLCRKLRHLNWPLRHLPSSRSPLVLTRRDPPLMTDGKGSTLTHQNLPRKIEKNGICAEIIELFNSRILGPISRTFNIRRHIPKPPTTSRYI